MAPILFYDPRDPYGFFSNFSRHQVQVYGRKWQTSEHAFQAMKFHPHRPDLVDRVFEATSPSKAAALGRDRTLPLVVGWDDPVELMKHMPEGPPVPIHLAVNDGRGMARVIERMKDAIMYQVVYEKFSQHEDLGKVLIDTGTTPIVENALHDPYWGWGSSQTGVNRLGKILMAVRVMLEHHLRPLVV